MLQTYIVKKNIHMETDFKQVEITRLRAIVRELQRENEKMDERLKQADQIIIQSTKMIRDIALILERNGVEL